MQENHSLNDSSAGTRDQSNLLDHAAKLGFAPSQLKNIHLAHEQLLNNDRFKTEFPAFQWNLEHDFWKSNSSLQIQTEQVSLEMINLIILLLHIPNAIQSFEEKGFSPNLAWDTLKDLHIWAEHHEKTFGRLGVGNLGWLSKHYFAKIVSIGRLQFEPVDNFLDVKVSSESRGLQHQLPLALTEVVKKDDSYSPWKTDINDHILQQYSIPEWECKPQSPVLSVHIPESGPLDLAACLRSLDIANQSPWENDPVAFVCSSWLMNPALRSICPRNSNIVAFQKLFYGLPFMSDDRQIRERVFAGADNIAPIGEGDTRLQAAIRKHYQQSFPLINGAGIIPRHRSLQFLDPAP
jgi:hypothetical protein